MWTAAASLLPGQRQEHLEAGSLRCVGDLKIAAGRLHYALANGETQAGAFSLLFGAKEGAKDAVQEIFGDAAAGVGAFQNGIVKRAAFPGRGAGWSLVKPHGDRARESSLQSDLLSCSRLRAANGA